jgi:hypothetical protein
MNNATHFVLKALRKLYIQIHGEHNLPPLQRLTDINLISKEITNLLSCNKPCMIARFGAFELDTIINYLCIKEGKKSLFKYITGETNEWWWNENLLQCMHTNAGFFPPSHKEIEKFCQLMLEDTKELDMLGSWRKSEYYLEKYLPTNLIKVDRDNINPFFADKPWTHCLKDKKVLVVHPFSHSIESQYRRKDKIFTNGLLPDFELKVIPAVQSIKGSQTRFLTWFEALDFMKSQIDCIEYDVCLLGCGAYGFPLAAHIKRKGKQAIHIGGALQLYFGIKGKRWEGNGYKSNLNNYSSLFNQYWIRPSVEETPSTANLVENSCYW